MFGFKGHNHLAMFGFKGHNHLAMFGFRISIQYPSGSVMNARPFILPAENGEQSKSEFTKQLNLVASIRISTSWLIDIAVALYPGHGYEGS